MYEFLKEKLELGRFPTPIEQLEKMGKEIGVNLFVKRDDLDEFIASGNKVRKLEYLLYDAKKQGCDTVLSAGGMQSNHCRATAYLSKKLSLNVELFLFGKEEFQGNLLLDKLLGAIVHPITKEAYANVMELMKKRAEELSNQGHMVYMIPPGGSNAIGLLGYANGVGEISRWERENVKFDYVVCATGTGGTIGGLEIGRKLHGSDFEVIGVNVTKKKAEDIEKEIDKMLGEFNEKFSTNFKNENISIIDGYTGEDYAVPGEEDFRTITEVALKEQIIFDPVYTAKAFKGLKDLVKKGVIKKGTNVLFLHTGGTFGIFAFANQLKKFMEA